MFFGYLVAQVARRVFRQHLQQRAAPFKDGPELDPVVEDFKSETDGVLRETDEKTPT